MMILSDAGGVVFLAVDPFWLEQALQVLVRHRIDIGLDGEIILMGT